MRGQPSRTDKTVLKPYISVAFARQASPAESPKPRAPASSMEGGVSAMGQGSWLSILGRKMREHLQQIVEQPLPDALRNLLGRSGNAPRPDLDKRRPPN